MPDRRSARALAAAATTLTAALLPAFLAAAAPPPSAPAAMPSSASAAAPAHSGRERASPRAAELGAHAPTFGVPLTASLRAELDSYLDAATREFDVPGAAVALVRDGEVAYLGGVGVRDHATSARVDARTRFMIGSLTKPLTALMAATLVDDGLLDWDARVTDIFPDFALSDPAATPGASFRHLLSHSSGVRRSGFATFGLAPRPLELVSIAETLPMLAAPGEVFEYSNVMFAIGGFAAARVAGAPLDDRALERGYARLMRERVFDRVGMPRTTLDFDRAVASHPALPHAYSPLAEDWVSVLEFERFVDAIAPAGAIWSSAADMARYLIVLLGQGLNAEGERVVSSDALRETLRKHGAVPGFPSGGYGLGMGMIEIGGVTHLQHDGTTHGFGSRLIAVPDQGWGVVVLSNRSATAPFLDAVVRYVTAVVSGGARSPDDDLIARDRAVLALQQQAFAATLPIDPASAAVHAGRYERDVRVSLGVSELIVHLRTGEMPFRALSAQMDRFASVGPIETRVMAAFTRSAEGVPLLSFGYPDAQGQMQPAVVLARSESSAECR